MRLVGRSKHYASLPVVGALAAALLLAACSQSGQHAPPTGTSASTGNGVSIGGAPAFAPFDGTIPANLTNTQCALDIINGEPSGNAAPINGGSTATFGGWVGHGDGQAANDFALVLKGTQQLYSVPLVTGTPRPDVAKNMNSDGMKNSGFNLVARLTGVVAGNYALYVANPSNSAEDCDLRRALTVK